MPDFGAQVVTAARGWIGTPFHWGASIKGVGCDCKGLLAGVARELDRPEGRSMEAAALDYGEGSFRPERLESGLARLFDRLASPVPGCVLLINIAGKPQHLSIATGEGTMIHTYGKGPQMVLEVPFAGSWKERLASAWGWRHVG